MKRKGFFVEFGATNGLDLSNTLLLERTYGWSGILAEPNPQWHSDLKANRASKNCKIDERCVWRKSGEVLDFAMAKSGTLSTLTKFQKTGAHAKQLVDAAQTKVETISLNDPPQHPSSAPFN